MDRSGGNHHGGSPRVLRAARMSAPMGFTQPDFGSRGPLRSSFLYAESSSVPMFARAPPRRPVSFASSPPPDSDATHDAVESSVAADPIVDETPPARRSTRKRKAPEMLEPSPESSSRKPPPVESRKSSGKKPHAKKKHAPARLKSDPDDDDDEKEECDSNCCICMTEPEPKELATINGCEHFFCFGCIEKWADRENTCPLCKTRFVSIDYVHKAKGRKTSVKVKNKSQRSELTSSVALESLFGEHGIAFESFFARLGSSSRLSTQIARIVVGGMPAHESGRPVTRAARAAAASGSSPDAAGSSSSGRPRRVFTVPDWNPPAREPSSGVRFTGRFADVMFGDEDDDDSDDDGNGFSGFVSTIRDMEGLRRRGRTGATFSFSGLPSMHLSAFPSPPSRSYASNSHDATAGASADNALEIEDSDDDDDEVQIVGSRPPTRSRGM